MIIDNPTISGSALLSGSLTITGSLNVSGSISGLASNAVSASYALIATSASYALNATTASYALIATSASYALASTSASYSNNATSASYSNDATSASYALASTSASYSNNSTSASYAANSDLLDGRDSLTFANTGSNNFVGTQNINGSVAITGSLTTTGAITAQTLNVQQVTSSIVYSSGSNIFGNSVSNTQSMTGSVGISGSLAVTGASIITGVLTLNSTITNGTYTYTLPSSTGTLALTSALSGYLPLAGGTLTGALSGTSATFSDTSAITLTAADSRIIGGTLGGRLFLANSSTSTYAIIYGATNAFPNTIQFYNNNTLSLSLASTGAATFSSSVTLSGTNSQLLQTTANSIAGDNAAVFYNSNANSYGLYIGAGSGTNHALYITDSTRTKDLFKVEGNGNVGIGTTSPNVSGQGANQRILTVQGTSGVWGGVEVGSTGTTFTGALNGFYGFTNAALSTGYTLISYIGSWLDGGGVTSGADMRFFTQVGGTAGAIERMRITAVGTIGIGVTPNAWFTSGGYKVLQIGAGLSLDSGNDFRARLASNAYVNTSGDWAYANAGFASNYTQTSGTHVWSTAPSGAAGNAITFTERMTITAAGAVTRPSQPFAMGALASNQSISLSTFTTLAFQTNQGFYGVNTGSCWNNSTYTFTAPVTGVYMVNLSVQTDSIGQVALFVNGVRKHSIPSWYVSGSIVWGGSALIPLTAGEALTLQGYGNAGTVTANNYHTWFAIYLL